VQLDFVRVIKHEFIIVLYVVRFVCKFDIGLLQAKHPTNGDQWKGQTVIESLYIFPDPRHEYWGAHKSLARPTSLSIVFSVQGTDGSPTGPDPENRVGDQDIGSPDRPVS
jgi:hypothetical protein